MPEESPSATVTSIHRSERSITPRQEEATPGPAGGDQPPPPTGGGGNIEVELARMNGRIDTLHTALEGSLRTLEAESRGMRGIVDARLQETKAWLDGMPAKAVIAMLIMLLAVSGLILGGIRAMDILWPPQLEIEQVPPVTEPPAQAVLLETPDVEDDDRSASIPVPEEPFRPN